MTDGCYFRVAYGALQKETVAEGIGRLVTGLRAIPAAVELEVEAGVADEPASTWAQLAAQTSSSSASSARSMMKRNRADASLPISSLITRSVTI